MQQLARKTITLNGFTFAERIPAEAHDSQPQHHHHHQRTALLLYCFAFFLFYLPLKTIYINTRDIIRDFKAAGISMGCIAAAAVVSTLRAARSNPASARLYMLPVE